MRGGGGYCRVWCGGDVFWMRRLGEGYVCRVF